MTTIQILNEVAGRAASKVVAWVVPQIMQAWDDPGVDVDRLLNRIIHGVMHHPAQRAQGEDGARDGRSIMFRTVEEWWGEKDPREQEDYRRKLSRDGVEAGENHKEGVHDTGHGCGKPLGMHKQFGGSGGSNTMGDRIATAAAGAIMGGITSGISDVFEEGTGYRLPTQNSQGTGPWASGGSSQQQRTSSQHGGGIGGLIGDLLGGAFKPEEETRYQSSGRTADGGYQHITTEYGHHGDSYGQAEERVTEYPDGRSRTEFSEFEQRETGSRHGERRPYDRGAGYIEETETQPVYGGGYRQHTERRWEDTQGGYRREDEDHTYGGGYGGGPRGDYASGHRQETYVSERQQEEYGRGVRDEYEGVGGFGGGRNEEYGGGRQEDYGRGSGYEFQSGARGGWDGDEERREERRGWGGEPREEYEERYEERREEGGGGFGGGMFGGGGENILEELAEEAAETFVPDDDSEERRGGRWGF